MKKVVNTHLISGHGYYIEGESGVDFEMATHILIYVYEDGVIGYRSLSKWSIQDPEEDDDNDEGECLCKTIPYLSSGCAYGTIMKERIESKMSEYGEIYINQERYTNVELAILEFKSHGVQII